MTATTNHLWTMSSRLPTNRPNHEIQNILTLVLYHLYTFSHRMKNYLSLVKFSHTIFAMPFAMVGYFLAVHTVPHQFEWRTLGLVLLCMVFARNAAMAFNRYIDRDIDGLNPRTAIREIPAGVLRADAVLWFVIANAVLFVGTTYFINTLCFYLSPVALLITIGYSLTKRFTALCHMVLGLGLALAPVGAYLAVTGSFSIIPVLYGSAVLCWVAGFDIIYALQDFEFDMTNRLRSTPVWLGKANALRLSNALQIVCAGLLVYAGYLVSNTYPSVDMLMWIGTAAFLGLLVYQHTLVQVDDLSRINLAFFTTNGIASILFGTLLIIDLYV